MGSFGQINIKAFCFNYFQENCYVLWKEGGDCVIVDPGCYNDSETGSLVSFMESNSLTPVAIWLTHGHFDHLFGAAELGRKYSLPVNMADDTLILDNDGRFARDLGLKDPDISFPIDYLVDGQELPLGFKVITTPGHTPGCICFYNEEAGILLSGDTLFAGAIGRTDLLGGDYDKEIVSIMDKLMGLPGDVDVLPGHGPGSSIAVERTGNPFLQPFNEPWETEID